MRIMTLIIQIIVTVIASEVGTVKFGLGMGLK